MRIFVETPRVLGSRLRSALSAAVVLAFVLAAPGPGFADQRSAQSVKPAGVTFNLAQVLDWIGEGVFAVGRWDGTISVFRVPGRMNSVQWFCRQCRRHRGAESRCSLLPTT